MDITQICKHCLKEKKVFRVSLDLFNADGLLKNGVMRMKKFEFMCTQCGRKSFLDFNRFSHPDVILLLKRLDEQDTKFQQTIDQLVIILRRLNEQHTKLQKAIDQLYIILKLK